MKTIRLNAKEEQVSPANFAAKPVIALFAKQHLAIWHAARLLGGYEASRLVDRCIGALERDSAITDRVLIMLDQILAVLSLEKVHDPDQPYMGYFAVIDPVDPVVEEICLLTDDLRAAIEEARQRNAWASKQQKVPEAA